MKRLNAATRNRLKLSSAIVTHWTVEQANARAFLAITKLEEPDFYCLADRRGKIEVGDVIHGTLRNGEIYLDATATE